MNWYARPKPAPRGQYPGEQEGQIRVQTWEPIDTARTEAEVMKLLLNAESLDINPDYQPKKGTPTVHSELGELYLSLEGAVDTAAEKARLKKELEKTEAPKSPRSRNSSRIPLLLRKPR